jgi:hypothetical protein
MTTTTESAITTTGMRTIDSEFRPTRRQCCRPGRRIIPLISDRGRREGTAFRSDPAEQVGISI